MCGPFPPISAGYARHDVESLWSLAEGFKASKAHTHLQWPQSLILGILHLGHSSEQYLVIVHVLFIKKYIVEIFSSLTTKKTIHKLVLLCYCEHMCTINQDTLVSLFARMPCHEKLYHLKFIDHALAQDSPKGISYIGLDTGLGSHGGFRVFLKVQQLYWAERCWRDSSWILWWWRVDNLVNKTMLFQAQSSQTLT